MGVFTQTKYASYSPRSHHPAPTSSAMMTMSASPAAKSRIGVTLPNTRQPRVESFGAPPLQQPPGCVQNLGPVVGHYLDGEVALGVLDREAHHAVEQNLAGKPTAPLGQLVIHGLQLRRDAGHHVDPPPVRPHVLHGRDLDHRRHPSPSLSLSGGRSCALRAGGGVGNPGARQSGAGRARSARLHGSKPLSASPTSRHARYAISWIPGSAADGGGPVVLGYPQHLIRCPNVDGVAIGCAKSVVVVIVEKRAGLVPGENASQLVTRDFLVFSLTERIVVVD